jgi:acyl-CoA synthetase (NDP forming)
LNGGRIGAMSSSGGDLTLIADALGPVLTMPSLSSGVAQRLRHTIHERIVPANPFDFQMFDWNDEDRLAESFSAFLSENFDLTLCVLDYPREDLCDQSTWGGAERGFVRAIQQTGAKGAVFSTFSDTINESVVARLMKEGIVSLAGVHAGLAGIQAAVNVGYAWRRPLSPPLLPSPGRRPDGPGRILDEAQSKALLARHGVPVPPSQVVASPQEAVAAAGQLGYPVVVKASGLPHKSDVGGVRLDLGSPEEVSAAVLEMSGLSDSFLVEKMVEGVVAELIVGVAHDEQFGPYLLVGGGGMMVELLQDSHPLLIPITKQHILDVFNELKCSPLFYGFRGAQPADLKAAAEAIQAVARMVQEDPSAIIELDINPLLLLARGQGVVAADALIILNEEAAGESDKVAN